MERKLGLHICRRVSGVTGSFCGRMTMAQSTLLGWAMFRPNIGKERRMYDPLLGTACATWVIQSQKLSDDTGDIQARLWEDRLESIDKLVMPGDPAPVVYELGGCNRYGAPFLHGWYTNRSHAEFWIGSIEKKYRPCEIVIRTIYTAEAVTATQEVEYRDSA